MNCIKCHIELPPDALYCPQCGKRQTPEKRKGLKRANGTGTVYKLAERRRRPWAAARNKVIIGYYEKKTEALEALERLAGRSLTERYNMTLEDVYEAWKAEHFKDLTKSTQQVYDYSFRTFEKLHKRKFRDLRTADFQAVLDENETKPEMVKKYRQLIGQMSKWAIREEISTTNFAQFLKSKTVPKKEKAIFTELEIRALEQDGSEAARIVLMLLATGMRIGELFNLPLAAYHETYVVGGSKTEAVRNRVIPIRPEGREHFAYFAARAQGDLLLSGYTGNLQPQNYRNRDYYLLLARLGIPKKTPHSTRRTYASRAVREGMPPEILQKILGHANYSTTVDIYTHMDTETLVKAVEVTDRLLIKENPANSKSLKKLSIQSKKRHFSSFTAVKSDAF